MSVDIRPSVLYHRCMNLRGTTRERGAEVPNRVIGLAPTTARRWNGLGRVRARTARAPQEDSCGMASRATCHGFSLQAEACLTFVALTSPDPCGRLLLSTSKSGSSDPNGCLEGATGTGRPLGLSERLPILLPSGGHESLAQATRFSDSSGNPSLRLFRASAMNAPDTRGK